MQNTQENPILELLTTRRSGKKLSAPAPNTAQIDAMLQAATQVPDHGNLTPYRFLVIPEKKLGKILDKKAPAPLAIAVIASPKLKKKPKWEQHLSAGCATYAIQLAAKAQGFDSLWLTGKWTNNKKLKRAANKTKQEKIIALLLIGTARKATQGAKNTQLERYVSHL